VLGGPAESSRESPERQTRAELQHGSVLDAEKRPELHHWNEAVTKGGGGPKRTKREKMSRGDVSFYGEKRGGKDLLAQTKHMPMLK